MKKINQQNPPSPAKKRVDSNGNDSRKFAVKDGGTTMPIVIFPSENACKVFDQWMKNAIKDLHGKLLVKTVNFR